MNVPVNAVRAAGGMPHATVTLTAKSESSPTATSTATCQLSVINTMPPLH
ncbi:hypothetical protein [Kibdelosporangium aridum]